MNKVLNQIHKKKIMSVEIIPIPSKKIIEVNDDLVPTLLESIKEENIEFKENDIVVIASKVISYSEGRVVKFKEVRSKISEEAIKVSKKAKIPPEFAQVILEECNGKYIGTVPGAVTTINKYGLLANAGADQSNVGENKIILLPEDIKNSAKRIYEKIFQETNIKIPVIIADSRTAPLRLGTIGSALGTFGFQSVIDERGKLDLFNRKMHITNRAVADQLASAAELLMGETNEQIPFVIVRNYTYEKIQEDEEKDINNLISIEDCMFIGPLWDCLVKKMEDENEY